MLRKITEHSGHGAAFGNRVFPHLKNGVLAEINETFEFTLLPLLVYHVVEEGSLGFLQRYTFITDTWASAT